jgi:hypothetical protein
MNTTRLGAGVKAFTKRNASCQFVPPLPPNGTFVANAWTALLNVAKVSSLTSL